MCFLKVVKKETEKEEGNQYLYLLNLKYEDRFTEDDDVESLSDVGESDKEQLMSEDKELDVLVFYFLILIYYISFNLICCYFCF